MPATPFLPGLEDEPLAVLAADASNAKRQPADAAPAHVVNHRQRPAHELGAVDRPEGVRGQCQVSTRTCHSERIDDRLPPPAHLLDLGFEDDPRQRRRPGEELAAERHRQLGACREPPVGVFLQTPQDRLFHRFGNVGLEAPRVRRSAREMHLQQVEPRVTHKRPPAGQQLEDDHRQRVLIGPPVGGTLGRLLGRCVRRSTGEPPVVLTAELTGQPQVEDLELPLLGCPDVLGLEVAMHDLPLMRKIERLRQRTDDHPHFIQRQPAAALDHLAEGFTLDVLEHRERTVVLKAEVEHRGNRRMHQTGTQAGLFGKRRLPLAVHGGRATGRGIVRQDHLHRDRSVESLILTEINDTHSTPAQLLDQPIPVLEDGPAAKSLRTLGETSEAHQIVGPSRSSRATT